MIVIPGTSSVHAVTFARALDVPVVEEPKLDDWGILVGVSPNPSVQKYKDLGTRMVAYWIGSDSYSAVTNIAYRKNIDVFDKHICVHERIKRELKEWGVDAEVVYPCSRNYSDGLPEATKPMVGVYMPEPELYMYAETVQIAKENPDLPFVFYGAMSDFMKGLPPNVKDAARMTPEDTKSIQDEISVMLRLCRHDGNPVSGIEMKQRNRHVIENYAYKGFLYAHTMGDVNRHLRNPEIHRGDYGPWPAYYREQCSPQAFKKNIERLVYGK